MDHGSAERTIPLTSNSTDVGTSSTNSDIGHSNRKRHAKPNLETKEQQTYNGHRKDDVDSDDDDKTHHQHEGRHNRQSRRRRRRRSRMQRSPVITSSSILPFHAWTNIGQRAVKVAVRKVKKASHHAYQFLFEDDDGNRDEGEQNEKNKDKACGEETLHPTETNPPNFVHYRKQESTPTPTAADAAPNPNEPLRRRPIRDILQELNQFGTSYPPNASRQELETLLESLKRHAQSAATSLNSSKSQSNPFVTEEDPPQQDRQQSSHNLREKKQQRIGNVAGNVRKFVSDRFSSFHPKSSTSKSKSTSSDYKSNGIVDAIIEDYSKDPTLMGIPTLEPTENGNSKEIPPKRKYQEYRANMATREATTQDTSGTVSSVPRKKRYQNASAMPDAKKRAGYRSASKLNQPSGFSAHRTQLPQLPPAVPSSASRSSTRRKRSRRTHESNDRSRRIYSPYNLEDSYDGNPYQDTLDRVGDFVAGTVETFLWGPFDEHNHARRHSTKRAPIGKESSSSTSDDPHSRPTGRRHNLYKKHWKDRMEEHFDHFMGIHEPENEYNRWLRKDREDANDEGGYDAFSVAQGRQPKRRRQYSYDKPMWEEEGSFLSVLFGTSGSKNNAFLDRSSAFLGSGSLLKLFKSVFKSLLLIGGSLGRWASVRGALPQPVVVVGVIAAGLSARRHHRLWSMIITLVVMRTLGELIHGYMYDDFDEDAIDDGEKLNERDFWDGD